MNENGIPIPMKVTLPSLDWVPVATEPASGTAPAFVANRRNMAHDVVPTIRLSGELRDDAATLVQLADRLVKAAAEDTTSVELLHRREVGGENAPGLTQALAIVGTGKGQGLELRRSQVLLAMRDVDHPTRRIVVLADLTCAADQFSEMAREFQTFVANMAPAASPSPREP